MKDYIKKIVLYVIIPLGLYLIYGIVQKIISMSQLTNALVNYLDNLYDQKPTVDATYTLNKINIAITFEDAENLDLQQIKLNCIDYVESFFPKLNIQRIEFEVK